MGKQKKRNQGLAGAGDCQDLYKEEPFELRTEE